MEETTLRFDRIPLPRAKMLARLNAVGIRFREAGDTRSNYSLPEGWRIVPVSEHEEEHLTFMIVDAANTIRFELSGKLKYSEMYPPRRMGRTYPLPSPQEWERTQYLREGRQFVPAPPAIAHDNSSSSSSVPAAATATAYVVDSRPVDVGTAPRKRVLRSHLDQIAKDIMTILGRGALAIHVGMCEMKIIDHQHVPNVKAIFLLFEEDVDYMIRNPDEPIPERSSAFIQRIVNTRPWGATSPTDLFCAYYQLMEPAVPSDTLRL